MRPSPGGGEGFSILSFSSHFSVLSSQLSVLPFAFWLLTSQSPATAAYDLPESCPACCATTFISFSSEEKRCMIS